MLGFSPECLNFKVGFNPRNYAGWWKLSQETILRD